MKYIGADSVRAAQAARGIQTVFPIEQESLQGKGVLKNLAHA